ncbi:YraN family protein [Leucobacter sp. VD1]|uniref:YraN family protein n=1 Tax=Leucobacter sp. VD1 TaxID=3080381 RepID=UPI003017DA45
MNTSTHNQTLGAHGEAIAAAFLEERGFVILDRNWRNRYGELDLIAQEGRALVAVEVKTRSGDGFGSPLSAITARKASRLRRLLLDWARAHDSRAPEMRIDAVGITLCGDSTPRIDHLRGIQ